MRDQPIENGDRVRPDDQFVMIGPEMRCDAAGMFELVERRLVEADRERLDLRAGRLRHQSDDEARVDAARKECPERYVAHKMRADRLRKHATKLFDRLDFRAG